MFKYQGSQFRTDHTSGLLPLPATDKCRRIQHYALHWKCWLGLLISCHTHATKPAIAMWECICSGRICRFVTFDHAFWSYAYHVGEESGKSALELQLARFTTHWLTKKNRGLVTDCDPVASGLRSVNLPLHLPWKTWVLKMVEPCRKRTTPETSISPCLTMSHPFPCPAVFPNDQQI